MSNLIFRIVNVADRYRNPGSETGTKKFKLYDRDGLFLLVNPGGSKLWRWRHRVDGKERLMTFGAYPLVSLCHARQLHFEARKTLAAGIDPMGERRAKADAKREGSQSATAGVQL